MQKLGDVMNSLILVPMIPSKEYGMPVYGVVSIWNMLWSPFIQLSLDMQLGSI